VFLAVALIGVLIWPRQTGGTGIVRALAVYGLFLAATLASPFLLRPLARVAAVPFGLVAGFETRLARSAFIRDPSRATLTVGAMAIGLAMMVALGSVGQNARLAATDWLEDVVPGDLVLTSIRPVGLDEGVSEILADLPGVERISPIASFEIAVGGVRTDAAAIVGADFAADGRLTFVSGDRAAALAALDAGGATIVPAGLAQRLGVSVGDTLVAPTGDGDALALRVVGIVERAFPGRAGDTMLVGWADAVDRLGAGGADVFAVRFEPTASADQRAAFEQEARSFALEPSTLDRIAGAISDALGRVFGLFDALAVIAVIVAALGIVNTLSMGVLERVREIGILRAVGMTRRQVWRMVVVEAGIVGLVGAVIGIVTGVLLGVVMVVLTGGTVDVSTVVPWLSVGLAFVLGVVLAMLAAAYPATIAGRITIVRAVRYE
jgi:putative ABC transport system permease protein